MACLCTEFEDASFSYSTEMKEDPKRKNVDDVEWLGSLKVIGSVTIW